MLALPAVLTPAAAEAVIFYDSADPVKNTTAPTGSLANSGWQYEFGFRGFLGTPVAPHYFLTAAHLDQNVPPSLDNTFSYQGMTYNTIAFGDGDHAKDFGDLRLYRVDNTFYSYAPLYNAATDGAETAATDNAVVIGRGRQRGSEITLNNTLKGWYWGIYDGVERWGENGVAGFENYHGADTLLKFNFDAGAGPNEATLAEGDSGGGVFMTVKKPGKTQGEWKLSGVNFAVSGPYSFSMDGPNFVPGAALFDTSGLWDRGDPAHPVMSTGPSSWYASRVSASLGGIDPLLDLSPTWDVDGNGVWGTAGSWLHGGVPDGIDATANFRTVITAAHTVTVDAPRTIGTINFDNPAYSYTLAGSAITLDVSAGSAQINVASGNHTIAAPLVLNDPLTVRVLPAASTLTLSGALTANGKTITKEGDGAVALPNLRAAGVVINAGRINILPSGTNAGTSKVTSIAVNGTGKLDLTNNHLIVDYTGGSVLANVTNLIASGRNGGAWNGSGIVTSSASGNVTTLGVAEASKILGLTATQTALWHGQTADATSVLVKYTYGGDANLDGKINVDDYGRIDFNVPLAVSGWYNGDFNYDGKVNVDDYGIIDFNIGIQGAPLSPTIAATPRVAGLTAVPEPTAFAVTATGLALAVVRRRRRIERIDARR